MNKQQLLKEKVTKEVTGDVTKKLVDVITGGKQSEVLSPWAKEERVPRNYEEVAEWGEKRALKRFEDKQKAAEKERIAIQKKAEGEQNV